MMMSSAINRNSNKSLFVRSQLHKLNMALRNKPQPSKLTSSVFHRMESTTTTTSPTPTSTAGTGSTTAATTTTTKQQSKGGWWHSAELWGTAGALACWGMAGSASYVYIYNIV